MDLSNNPNPYNDTQGQPLAMLAIIKDSVSSLDVYGNLDLTLLPSSALIPGEVALAAQLRIRHQ